MPPKKDAAPKKKRIKYSRWLLTVDPRKKTGSYPGGEAGLRANLEKCARLLRPPFLEKFVYLTPKGHTYAVNILESSAEHAIEKGPKRGFWHMHALITLRHDSNVRLSYPIFRAACAKIMGGTVHFDAKLARGGESLEDIRQYIHKGKQVKQEEAEV
jgi:hypothetical protein